MEGSVGVADSNCDSDKHVKCPKCSTTTEKHVPQPTIDEKHKQKNQEILERKHKLSNAGRNLSRKIGEPESHQLAAKFAFEWQQQKKVEVFDSHAVDFTQHKDSDDHDDIFLPRHLKKRQSSQQLLNVNRGKEENNTGDKQASQTAAGFGDLDQKQTTDDRKEGSDTQNTTEDFTKALLASRPQLFDSPQHDTLRSYLKFRKYNMAREDRLRKVQCSAKLRDSEKAAYGSPGIICKPTGQRTILPPLKRFSCDVKVETSTDTVDPIKERHGILPKIYRRKNKERDEKIGKDPRFQKLISCLVPLTKSSERSPSFTRKRHFTM